MKSLTIVILISVALYGPGTTKKPKVQQEFKEMVHVMESRRQQQKMLTGIITKNDLEQSPYSHWFNRNYDSYDPVTEDLDIINEHIHQYDIKIIMGTWCPDSRREVPKFFKILELTDYDLDKLEMLAVDRTKIAPENVENSTPFIMVPTIVFFKDGKEVNRYVEFSLENFEKDIANIVSQKKYTNPYSE